MKTPLPLRTPLRALALGFTLIALTAGTLTAQRGPQERPNQATRPDPQSEQAETMMLGRLAQMNDEQLVRLRTAIDEILAMTPEQRAEVTEGTRALRDERVSQARENLDNRRDRIAEIPPGERAEIRERMRQMTPEERREMREELREMTPEERMEALRQRGRGPRESSGQESGRRGPAQPGNP